MMEFRYQDGDETHVIRVTETPLGFEVAIGLRRYQVTAAEVDSATLDLTIDRHFLRTKHAADGESRWIAIDGQTYQATRIRHRRKRRSSGQGDETLAATMPGQVMAVLVSAGEQVERGQTLILMEAMKMELRVTAPNDGTVARVLVGPGETVDRGQTLVEMKAG